MNANTINRTNNFDFIRLLLATLVIVSHSYPLTKESEMFSIFTNHQETLGGLAVKGFFAISGYFIFISLKSSKTITNYFWKRVLRLFPALIVLMLFSVIIFLNVYKGPNLWAEPTFITYIPNCLSLYNVQFRINGIFEDTPYTGGINGSLWSLCYEFTIYCLNFVVFHEK